MGKLPADRSVHGPAKLSRDWFTVAYHVHVSLHYPYSGLLFQVLVTVASQVESRVDSNDEILAVALLSPGIEVSSVGNHKLVVLGSGGSLALRR